MLQINSLILRYKPQAMHSKISSGSITNYRWKFTGIDTSRSNKFQLTYKFKTAGNYSIKYILTSNKNLITSNPKGCKMFVKL
jgi:hypothetical protein